MTEKQRAAAATEALKKEYPEAVCSLDYTDPLQLLVATRLSAQCTDARVNLVTPELFEKYPDVNAFANAELTDVESIVRSCGFFHTKAADIIEMSRQIIERFDGRVPDNIDDLISLQGVGRKTANLIVGDIYGKPAVVADTHLIRITNLLGLVATKDPKKVEFKLKELLDPAESNNFCHRCVLHGRAVCVARRPACEKCCMYEFCRNSPKKQR
ncbi:MAG: endonuclease III [Clostridia bacterium]|nr:endonuclease III [Clostridia bacterium]